MAGPPVLKSRRVLLDLYGTNHDSRYWDDPERFDPERFLGEEPQRFALVPQGGGDPAVHHRCPGEPIATRLMIVALDQLVRHMTHTAPAPSAPVDSRRCRPAATRSDCSRPTSPPDV